MYELIENDMNKKVELDQMKLNLWIKNKSGRNTVENETNQNWYDITKKRMWNGMKMKYLD